MAPLKFEHVHRVTYAECTLGNHVYYARYLDFLEEARNEFFRNIGTSFLEWQQLDVIFPVIECRLRYKSPARYDDALTIELWPTMAEGVRINFAHRITNQVNSLILEAEAFHVCTGFDEKPKRLPEELLLKLQPHLRSTKNFAQP